MSLLNPDATPQFNTAEMTGQPAGDRCKGCGRPITGSYYRVGSHLACLECADRLKRETPQDSRGAFVRGLLFGVGGALIGLIIYAAFTILTGFYLGYIALAVGFIVAKAVMLGSKGIGGKRYQITAVLLTYAAVSMAAIPIWFHAYTQEKGTSGPQAKQVASSNPDSGSLPKSQEQDDSKPSFGKAIRAFGFLALIGLASPFLELQDPFHGIIGLVILLVGIRIAWKMTAGKNQLEIYGPFEASKSASV